MSLRMHSSRRIALCRSFRGDSAFYTWLYRIGINTAKNHLVANKTPSADQHAVRCG